MTENTTGGARKFLTRILATGALLGIYCMGTLAMTGALMGAAVSSAQARVVVRGGGYRGYRGGGYRGYRGGARRWVCRHNGYTSYRRCFWAW